MSYFRPLSLVRGLAFFTSLTVAANIEVTVGKDSKLEFNPPYIKAAIGDTVTYKFFAKVDPRRYLAVDTQNTNRGLPEPCCCPVYVRRPVPSSGERHIFRLYSERIPRCRRSNGLHHHDKRHKAAVVLLVSSHALYQLKE